MKKKSRRRVLNWSEYNASLKQRESGALWVGSEATANWTTESDRAYRAQPAPQLRPLRRQTFDNQWGKDV